VPTDPELIPIWDGVFNPLIGCQPVSTGCYSCYTALLSFLRSRRKDGKHGGHDRRFTHMIGPWKQAMWTGRIEYFPERVTKFLESRGPTSGIIAACTTSDLFARGVPFCIIDKIVAAMLLSPRHTFLVLTKWHDRLHEYAEYVMERPLSHWASLMRSWQPETDMFVPPLPWRNIWMGVSAENNEWIAERSKCLGVVRGISQVPVLAVEPLLEHSSILEIPEYNRPGWVTIAGEHCAGRGYQSREYSRRPCVQHWIESLLSECFSLEIPPFVRQLGDYFWAGANGSESRLKFKSVRGDDIQEWPQSLRVRHLPTLAGSLLFSEPREHERRQAAVPGRGLTIRPEP
jgi:protein gp37